MLKLTKFAIELSPAGTATERGLMKVLAGRRPLPKMLHLIHVTSVGWGRRIVNGGQIEARHCNVFDTDLVYMFVGRPDYRLKNGAEKSDQINRFPCLFLISADGLGSPYHVYPFDTGAANAGMYGDAADPAVYLDEYELDPDLTVVSRFILWAFGSNTAYFEGSLRPKLGANLRYWQSACLGYIKIARLAASHPKPDRRASAIEIAYARNVALSGNAKVIVIPDRLLEDNLDLIKLLKKYKLNWTTYTWRPNERPDFYMRELRAIARTYVR